METIVPYTHYNYVLCNSLRSMYLIPTNLVFTFEEYVKSQLHFPLVSLVEGRSIDDYYRALNYLENKVSSHESELSLRNVISWFYGDVAKSILGCRKQNTEDFSFSVDSISCCEIPKQRILASDIQKSLGSVFCNVNWENKVNFLLKMAKESNFILLEMR